MTEWINPDYAELMAEVRERHRQQQADPETDQAPRRFFLIPASD